MQLYAGLDLHSRNTYIGFTEDLKKTLSQIIKVIRRPDPKLHWQPPPAHENCPGNLWITR
jgi:hypothetical protein